MPAAPAAPPPSASPTAPAAPVTSPSAPIDPGREASASEKDPSSFMGDIESDFADMDAGRAPASRDDKGKFRAADKPKVPDETKPPKGEIKPPEDATKPPGDETKPPEGESPKPVRAAELRTAYEGLKKRLKDELEPEVQRLRAKVQEYESNPPEAGGPILEKLKTIEARNKQLEERQELVEFQSSQKYETEYEQPYREMWKKAVGAFNQLTVREPAGLDDMGQPKFNRRPATEEDLIKLGSLPLSELDEAAQSMFGASHPRAIGYIESLRDLATKKQQAIVEATKKAGEWKQQRTLEQQESRKKLQTVWDDVHKGLQEKYPAAYKPDAADPDDVSSHRKGFALADLLFLGNSSLTPEQVEALPATFRDTVKAGKLLSDYQRVQLHALARVKMGNHERLLAARKKDRARIAELEKSLAEYERSSPPGGKAGAGDGRSDLPWDQQVEQELQALDKRG